MTGRHFGDLQLKTWVKRDRVVNLLLIIVLSHGLAFTSCCCMQRSKNGAERDPYQWIFLKRKNAIAAVKCAVG